MSLGELPTYTVVTDIVGNTTSGNCSFGKVVNLIYPKSEIKMAIIYIAVRLSMAQLVGPNSFILLTIFSWKLDIINYLCGGDY